MFSPWIGKKHGAKVGKESQAGPARKKGYGSEVIVVNCSTDSQMVVQTYSLAHQVSLAAHT
jgi:hypothetical protein